MTSRLRALLALLAALACLTSPGAGAADLTEPLILVAKRHLQDKLYGSSILLARAVGGDRHVGLIVNKPTKTTLGKLFPNHAPSRNIAEPVFLGGPVGAEVIFALVSRSESPGNRSLRIAPDLYLATDSRVVDRIIENDPAHARFFAGVVLWQPGELAEELRRGLWFVQKPRKELVLRKTTDGLWEELVTRAERRANTI